jgi:hypothetical protein
LFSQQWAAGITGRAERSIRDSSARLQRFGMLKVDGSKGKGHANVYWPIKPPDDWRLAAAQTDDERRLAAAQPDDRQIATFRPADCNTLTGGQPPPLPKNYQNSSFARAREANANDPNQRCWTSVKGRLAKCLSAGEMRSWIDPLQLVRIGEHDVEMMSPTEHAAAYIEANAIGDRMRDAWRAEVPTVARVVYVAAKRGRP